METKNRKNKLLRIAGLLFLIGMVTNFALTGTLAKYTASATGTSTASIAKFSVKVNRTELAGASSITFNLFSTAYELDGNKVSNTTEPTADVASGKVAPGTGGAFDLEVSNCSGVKVKVEVSAPTVSLDGVNILFSGDNTSWTYSIQNVISSASKTIDAGDDTSYKLVTIYWKWLFDASSDENAYDTTLGVAASASPTVTLKVTATQVD